MNANQVINQQDFCDVARELSEQAASSDRSLEEYLRALWLLVQSNRDTQVTYALLAQILAEALVSPIAPFDPDWLSYENWPTELWQKQPIQDDFAFLQSMLLYQIADLRRMKDEGVLDNRPFVLWLGIHRKNGATWFNFRPSTFLECAFRGLRVDPDSTACDWSSLAELLYLGQIYE